jgi:hypothetical protein
MKIRCRKRLWLVFVLGIVVAVSALVQFRLREEQRYTWPWQTEGRETDRQGACEKWCYSARRESDSGTEPAGCACGSREYPFTLSDDWAGI